MELYTSPMVDDDGKTLGRILYFRDISEHIKAHEIMRKAKHEVEKNAKMRTQFFAVVSHDVKSPLNSIMGFIDLLESSGVNETQIDYIETIKSSGEHLLTLINDILDFTKIEYGAMEFHVQNFGVEEVIANCVKSFLPLSKESGVELVFEVHEGVPEAINGDMLRFRQILINLLGNAMKFTHEGKVTVECMKHNDDYIRINVIDTGIGIDQDVQDYIFSPFSQADASIVQKYGGSGLGLAITKQLVEKFSGELTLESSPETGTLFSYTIPIDLKEE